MTLKRKWKFRFDRILAIFLGAALAAGFLISQRPRVPEVRLAQAAPSPRKVALATVEAAEIPVVAEAVGTVRSRRQTEIAARVLAEVREIRHQPGDEVEAGEILILLDSRELVARVEQSEANLKSREEALQEAKTEFERTKNLLQKEAATQQEFDIGRFRLAGAVAQELAARKGLEEAKILLGYATISAPFKGLIFEKRSDPGDLASPGKPLLGLYDPRQLRLEALVEERLLWTLKVKDRIEVEIDVLGRTIFGEVSEVVPAVDPQSRTGIVKIDLPEKTELRPGMFGRARIPISRRTAVAVPRSAVVRRGQLEMVFLASKDGKRAELAIVRSGGGVPGGDLEMPRVEILSGLKPGRRAVTSGAEGLADGSPIEEGAGTGGPKR